MRKPIKLTTALLASSLIITPIASVQDNNNIARAYTDLKNNNYNKNVEQTLKRHFNLSNADLAQVKQVAQQAKAEAKNSPEAQQRWKFSALKQVVRIFVRNVNALPPRLRPFVKTWGGKMIQAIDRLEYKTRGGAISALTKVGVPYPQAKLLADILMMYVF
ncbi:MAG: hypothetical protein Q3988_01490 [Gemella sp.]|nr:hypothetical protein [Gemella sp.]